MEEEEGKAHAQGITEVITAAQSTHHLSFNGRNASN